MIVNRTVIFSSLIALFLASSCHRNNENQGFETTVNLSSECFAEIITAESEHEIDTLIYTKVFIGRDSVISWQSPGINIGIDVSFDVDSNSSIKSYHFEYHELNAILFNRFNVVLNNSNEQYSNHRDLNRLMVGRQGTDSFSILLTDKGWINFFDNNLNRLQWFTSVIRHRKRLDANTKLMHRTYYYLGDKVNVITTELLNDH